MQSSSTGEAFLGWLWGNWPIVWVSNHHGGHMWIHRPEGPLHRAPANIQTGISPGQDSVSPTVVPTTPENTKVTALKDKTESKPAQHLSLPVDEEHFSTGKAQNNT